VLLGFAGSKHLKDLPAFAELRSAYKRASLALHPDKAGAGAGKEAGLQGEKPSSPMDFQEFRRRFDALVGRFYDGITGDFNAAVKASMRRRDAGSSHKKPTLRDARPPPQSRATRVGAPSGARAARTSR